ncbi:MAG: fumarylacetoacetate hydrolase family protein [Defluviicoccus sp.]|nr:fumarylacetoacetate hydrolase family protein [Defluviicoccus sp.]MDE0385302.1 fumarylacetoacetate hydrolase family protein [Defluviicoccus sp.]
MYLASFRFRDIERIGARIDDDHVVDFREAAGALGRPWDSATMLELIAGGEAALDAASRLLEGARDNPDIDRIPMADIAWLPPVTRPGKICGVALNNSASDARKISAPDHPMFFLKPSTCLVGHRQPIVARRQYMGFHPEPELGVAISRLARNVDPTAAMRHVFGYTIVNDVTGNDMRAEDRVHYYALYPRPDDPDEVEKREQHLSYTARYKGADGFGPAGPWLVTRDEVPDPHDLDVVCSVGGEVFAEDNTRHYTFRVEEAIAYISRYMTLEPGDIVSMGTAFRAGGAARRPLHAANFARLDGPCDISISRLGTLSNPIERDATEPGDWRLPGRR